MNTGAIVAGVQAQGLSLGGLFATAISSGVNVYDVPEVGDRSGETLLEFDLRAPIQHFLRETDIGPALHGIILGQRFEYRC